MHYVLYEILRENYTRITVSGKLDEAEYQKLHEDIVAISGQLSNVKLLLDVTKIELAVDPLGPLAQIQTVSEEVLRRIRKFAVLCSVHAREDAFTAEEALVRRGLDAKVFFDEMLAVEWLKWEG